MPFPTLHRVIALRGGEVSEAERRKREQRDNMRRVILRGMENRPVDLDGRPEPVQAEGWREFLTALGIDYPYGTRRQWRKAFYSLLTKYGRLTLTLVPDGEGDMVGKYSLNR